MQQSLELATVDLLEVLTVNTRTSGSVVLKPFLVLYLDLIDKPWHAAILKLHVLFSLSRSL